MQLCEKLAPTCDSKLDVVRGSRTDFKMHLYIELLNAMRLLLADLGILRMASEPAHHANDGGVSHLFELLRQPKSFVEMETDFMETFQTCMKAIEDILDHDNETLLDSDVWKALGSRPQLRKLDGVNQLYIDICNFKMVRVALRPTASCQFSSAVDELNASYPIRVAVCVSALQSATDHISKVGVLCMKEKVH